MLCHQGTKTLETPRLILRRFAMEDVRAMYENWASDPEVTKYLMWPAHSGVDVTEQVVKSWVEGYARENFYQWAIVPKKLGQPIGSIAVTQFSGRARSADIGYCIGRNWWRQGYTSEALKAVMDFLFDEVGVQRVAACHDSRNPNSGAVMRKCGMKYEGTLRRAEVNMQGLCDKCWYALLDDERQGSGDTPA